MSGSPDDYSLFLSENGHLSFENPNYQASLVSADILTASLGTKMNKHSLLH